MTNKIPFMNLQAQYRSIREELNEAVIRVLESGIYLQGQQLDAFEAEFAAYCGVGYAAGVASGTTAIQLALTACGVGAGDRVATVANVSAPTVAAIHAAGALAVLVDVCPDTCNMDPWKLEHVLASQSPQRKIKAVVPVHLYGHPAEIDRIDEICRRHDVLLVEDACQAHGAEFAGRKLGSFGHAGCFSFYPTKNLGAYGDAGAVVSDDRELIDKVKALRCYGEQERYYNTMLGINGRMEEMQAAALRVKLRHLERWNEDRRRLAAIYTLRLADSGLELPPAPAAGSLDVFHLYVVRSRQRDEIREQLLQRGIGTAVHYPRPIHFQPAFAHLGYREGDLPHSERCCNEVLSLPLYPELPGDQVEFVCQSILECR